MPGVSQFRITALLICLGTICIGGGASAGAEENEEDRIREMERQVKILTEEIEQLRHADVIEAPYAPRYGLGPAAARVYQRRKDGVSLAGYGEAIYQNFADERENGMPSGRKDEVDFLRAVLYAGFRFNDWILFNSEIEFEHGSTGKQGEVSVEFGYVELLLSEALNVRAGMVLVPVGIVNERHEPSTFHGSRRTEIEQAIIPSTWRANGAGVFGEVAPAISYRVYVTEGLNAAGFTAGGIRGGRQSASKAIAEDVAVCGRIEYEGILGTSLGASFFAGNSGQGAADSLGELPAMTKVFSVHGDIARRGLQLRALYATASVDDAGRINGLNELSGSASVGEEMWGWYVTAAYDILPLVLPRTTHWLSPFVQYQELDTQASVPSGFESNPANDRSIVTLGLTYKPHPNVAFKLDRQIIRNEARTGVGQWNVAMNYLF